MLHNVHYRFHKIPSLKFTLRQLNPVQTLTSYSTFSIAISSYIAYSPD